MLQTKNTSLSNSFAPKFPSHFGEGLGVRLLSMAANPQGMTVGEVEWQVAQCSGYVKMMTGTSNNCAYHVMMDALDQIRKHPKYKMNVKAAFEGKTNSVLSLYKDYRNNLRYTGKNGFFSLNEMPEEARKMYGAVTDQQYFEFWEATGSLPYSKSRPWVTSLWNKFRLSLQNHQVPYPEITAWGLTGASALQLSVETWYRCMRSVHDAVPVLKPSLIASIYAPFSLEKVAVKWRSALLMIAPETTTYKLNSTEERNITMGLNQLRELWASKDLPIDSTIQAVEDFADEIFRTKGEAKKAIRGLLQMRNDTHP